MRIHLAFRFGTTERATNIRRFQIRNLPSADVGIRKGQQPFDHAERRIRAALLSKLCKVRLRDTPASVRFGGGLDFRFAPDRHRIDAAKQMFARIIGEVSRRREEEERVGSNYEKRLLGVVAIDEPPLL